MARRSDISQPPYLTTKEVAELLRVKERKVYELAAEGEIPHRRITGKLLFPRAEIVAWIEGSDGDGTRPAVLTGSHDPLLDWAVRESGCGLAILLNGSLNGLDSFADGGAALCGLHVPEADGWNVTTVADRGLRDCVLIAWATRARGLILGAAAEDVTRVADLKGRRVALRQHGAGARMLFDQVLDAAGLDAGEIDALAAVARTESDAAAAVAAGDAEATIGLEVMARQFKLGFLPLVEERFDLLIDRRAYFTSPVQELLGFARRPPLAEKAAAMGGYDLTALGSVRWLSP